MSPLRIAIVVQGRFHAFDLARALLAEGHEVFVFTNYPATAVARFGFPADRVRSCVSHGVVDRIALQVSHRTAARYPERRLHEWFGRWAAREVARENWDVVHCWSGVSEELLLAFQSRSAVTLLMRGSAHIGVQDHLLREEERRSGEPLSRPSAWMIDRELREYQLANRIVVLSSFARRTFIDQGFGADRVSTLPLGVDVSAFQADDSVRKSRIRRMLSGAPLRVLYVGALSLQKGLLDLMRAASQMTHEPIEFRLVGPRVAETDRLLDTSSSNVRVFPKRPHRELPAVYHDADVFLFPTIQDGFGMVLTQAHAGGLPIVTTPNGGGPDVVTEGRDGWIIPIRDAGAIVERLSWCLTHRDELARMAGRLRGVETVRDWRAVARDFLTISRTTMTEISVHE